MGAALADQHAAALAQPGDAEGGEEQMEEARMVGVLDVLYIELPVVRQRLDEAADDLDRLLQHAANAPDDRLAEVLFNRRRRLGQGAEYQAAENGGAQLAWANRGH